MPVITIPIPALSEADKERFWSKIKIAGPSECWEWGAAKCTRGYGMFSIQKRMFLAHRIAYFLINGPYPEDQPETLHSCDNPGCVNPSHLSAGTSSDNAKDKVDKGRQPTGIGNWVSQNKDRLPRGDNHWSRLHPEKLATGERNGTHTNPDRVARGNSHGRSKLTYDQVDEIKTLKATGLKNKELAIQFGVNQSQISRILNKKLWNK